MDARLVVMGMVMMMSLLLPAPAGAAGPPTPPQLAARLVAARPTLPVDRQRQLDAVESGIDDASKGGVPNVDAITTRVVGGVPPKQLLSFEAMALSNLVLKRDADIMGIARSLADVLNRRATALAQLSSARTAGQPTEGPQGQVDALSELSETESLQLQMLMDRRSKLIDTLSNVLKKMADTSDSIVQNLK